VNIIACYVASRPETSDDPLDVRSPVDGRLVARTVQATEEQVERAVSAAAAVAPPPACPPTYVREHSTT
jgi:acyl-CoA reductase-like NAD-dependent aldehyde dehydrogenase